MTTTSSNSYSTLFVSKEDQVARTPSALLQIIRDMYCKRGEKLFDPCPRGWSEEKRKKWDALDPKFPWKSVNFINPPFDQTGKFFQRAADQMDKCVSIFLIPCRFHTRYFAQYAPKMNHVILLENQVRFVGYKSQLPVALCLVVFGKATLPVDFVTRPSKNQMTLVTAESGTLMATVKKLLPDESLQINNQVSDPLTEAMKKNTYSAISMPSRIENKVVWDKIITNPKVYLYFINPCLHMPGKLFNGTIIAILNKESNTLFKNNTKHWDHHKIKTAVLNGKHDSHNESTTKQILTTPPI